MLLSQLVLLSKWFKGQFSLPVVLCMFFTLMPVVMLGTLIEIWHDYIIPVNSWTLKGGFRWDEFADFQMIVEIVCFSCCVLIALVDMCADFKLRQL
jgi:hypothetical protein